MHSHLRSVPSTLPRSNKSSIYFFKELINFPPITLDSHFRQALMVPRPEDAALPQPTPNPYMTNASKDFAATVNSTPNPNKLKVRVPMERRYLDIQPPPLPSPKSLS